MKNFLSVRHVKLRWFAKASWLIFSIPSGFCIFSLYPQSTLGTNSTFVPLPTPASHDSAWQLLKRWQFIAPGHNLLTGKRVTEYNSVLPKIPSSIKYQKNLFLLLHRECCRVTQLLHQPLHIYKILYIKTLKTLRHVSILRPSSGSSIFLVKVTLEIVTY